MTGLSDQELRDLRVGHEAQIFMNGDVATTALADIRASILKEWQGSSRDETDKREDCYFMLSALGLFEARLKSYINRARAIESIHKEETP